MTTRTALALEGLEALRFEIRDARGKGEVEVSTDLLRKIEEGLTSALDEVAQLQEDYADVESENYALSGTIAELTIELDIIALAEKAA